MVIDFHTHIFPDHLAPTALEKLTKNALLTPYTQATSQSLAQSMAKAGINYSLLLPVATNPDQVAHINDWAAQMNDRRLVTGICSFGAMHPDCPDWHEELGRVAKLGLKGIKLHPDYQGVNFDDPQYLRILNRAGELNLAVLTHAGVDLGYLGQPVHCTPKMVLEARNQVGPVTLILAHMGGWQHWNEALELLPPTGVYLDTAFCLGDYAPAPGQKKDHLISQTLFLKMVNAFGAERILFATDSPWVDQRAAVKALRALPLSLKEKKAILGGNAQKILKLN